MTTLVSYRTEITKLDRWKQGCISEIQAGGSQETLFEALEQEYARNVSRWKAHFNLQETFEEEKATLEKTYWAELEVLDLKMKKEVVGMEQDIGQGEAKMAVAAMGQDGRNELYKKYEKSFQVLQKKYDMPPSTPLMPQPAELTEGGNFFKRVGQAIEDHIKQQRSHIEKTTIHLLENPNEIEIYVKATGKTLMKKKGELDAKGVSEGIVWDIISFPVRIPMWFWNRIYLPILNRYISGPIADYVWYKWVNSIDPTMDPKTAILHQGTNKEISKEEFDALANGVATVVIISSIIAVGLMIPGLGTILQFLYSEVVANLLP